MNIRYILNNIIVIISGSHFIYRSFMAFWTKQKQKNTTFIDKEIVAELSIGLTLELICNFCNTTK